MALSTIGQMIRDAEKHADAMAAARIRAVEYYQGTMTDTPADDGRSKMVSRDVRATIKKVLPSLVRTILGNENVVEFQPVGQGDEEAAEQASDYINFVLIEDCDGRRAIEDAIHDALLLRNGVLKWWAEEKRTAQVSEFSGLQEMDFAQVVSAEDVEVLQHSERVEMTELGPVQVHDGKIKRIAVQRRIRAAAVPRERFLIHAEAVTLEDAALVGEKCEMTRSDLVAMGYDKDTIWNLPLAGDDDAESDTRREFDDEGKEAERANERIDYYDVFVRTDTDGDGIAELRHMVFAGGVTERNLLLDEDAEEVQYCDVRTMTQPHQWEGISIFDDVADIQRAKTVLLRQTLDNLYWQNNPQPIMQDGAVIDPDAVFNPEFGKPISVRNGVDIRAAFGFAPVPMVADKSFAMMEYMDHEGQERTGVSDASSGLAPDALQNMTAKASAMIEAAGIGQTELMVRTVAEGLKRFFRGLLRLTIKHQDVARMVRLRGEWVQFDPRSWNAQMDCRVNTGLGAGTRERDMLVMQQVMTVQEKLLAAFGPDNPFVKPENIHNSVEKLIEAAGLKSPGMFVTKPDPQEVEQRLQAMRSQPSPEMAKVQAQAQADQAKLQAQTQADQAKMQTEAQIGQAKLQAEIQLKREQMQAEYALKREQMAAEMQLKREQMALEAELRASMPAPASTGGGVQFGGQVG